MSETEATEAASTPQAEAAKRASCRRVRTVAAFVLAAAGVALAWCSWPGPSGSSVARYIYGHGSQVPAVIDRVQAALCTDVLLSSAAPSCCKRPRMRFPVVGDLRVGPGWRPFTLLSLPCAIAFFFGLFEYFLLSFTWHQPHPGWLDHHCNLAGCNHQMVRLAISPRRITACSSVHSPALDSL